MPASVTDLSFMKTWGLDQDAHDLGVAIGGGPGHPGAHRQRLRQDLPARLEPRRPDRLRLPERRDPAPAALRQVQGVHPGGHLPEDRRAGAPGEGLRAPAGHARPRSRRELRGDVRRADQGDRRRGGRGSQRRLRRRPRVHQPSGRPVRGRGDLRAARRPGAGAVLPLHRRHLRRQRRPHRPALLERGRTSSTSRSAPRPTSPTRSWRTPTPRPAASPTCPSTITCAQINVPILYIGAGGGFGQYGLYTLTPPRQHGRDDPHHPA